MALVRAIIEVAAALGLTVVVEGVETDSQLETLLSLGCRRAQGFLVARPVSPTALAKLLS